MTTIFPRDELVLHAERTHLDDARVHVAVVGDDAGLAAGEADGIAAQLADRHRQERHRDALAGREQHVELAAGGVGRDLLRRGQQLVGGVAHRGDDDDDVVALLAGAHDALGHLFELLDVRDAAAAVLLDDHRHGVQHNPAGDIIRRPDKEAYATPNDSSCSLQ